MTNRRTISPPWLAAKLWLAAFLLSCIVQDVVHAQVDSYPTLPHRGNGAFTVSATMRTSETAGHVLFDIRSTVPSKADRELQLVVYLSNGNGNRAVRKNVVFPQGSMAIAERVHFSQCVANGGWDTGVYEDGRDLEDRRKQSALSGPGTQWWDTNNLSSSTFIFDPDDTSTLRQFGTISRDSSRTNGLYPLFWNYSQLEMKAVPERWGDLIQYGICIIPAKTLQAMKSKHPESFDSLLNYAYAGGTVVVVEVDALGTGLDGFENLINAPQEQRGVFKALQNAKQQWWTIHEDELYDDDEENITVSSTTIFNGVRTVQQTQKVKKEKPKEEEQTKVTLEGLLADSAIAAETYLQVEYINHFENFLDIADSLDIDTLEWEVAYSDRRYKILQKTQSEAFYSRSFGFGVFLLVPQELSALSRRTRNAIYSNAQTATLTRLSVASDGNWMWLNLIQSVGKPPVWTFCLAVALFSLFLGPGLLFLTGRKKRRSLMMLFVPAVSFLAASLILAYNVIYEGFDTYIRTSSVQIINDDEDRSFMWSRQNIFSGLPPRQGLTFPKETFARPIGDRSPNYYGGNLRRNIEWTATWTASGSEVWKNWLAARQQQQLLIGNPTPKGKVPIEINRLEDGKVEVKNVSDSLLPLVVFRGDANDYYWVEDLAPSEGKVVELTDSFSAGANVSRIMDDYRPKPPAELKTSSTLYEYARGRSSNYLYDDADDLIHQHLEYYFSDNLQLEPFEYATFNRDTSAAYKPIEGTSGERDLHLIVGRKQW